MSFGIEYRTARIAARGVVGGDKSNRHFAFGIGINAVVFLLIKFLEFIFNYIIVDIGIFFLHNSFNGCVIQVFNTIGRVVTVDFPVGYAQSEVGIGIKSLCRLHFHQCCCPYPFQTVHAFV
ncbi:MAG: hypothetical protein BWY27_00027 [Bacteroidetes bacterium ADurb.Bin234]|nr:MAG: hypothetical protein BWY27_00027 [Bacteroidetes bacterium ADurb.Bin234]